MGVTYKIYKEKDFANNKSIIDNIIKVLQTSYQEFDMEAGYLKKDFGCCNELYFAKNEEQELIAFFMVGLQELEGCLIYYLGLSACAESWKGNGIASSLYKRFSMDCSDLEKEINKRILCYWTTATPIAFNWLNHNFENVAPDLKGYCTEEDIRIIELIAKKFYPYAKYNKKFPYVLRNAVNHFRFSDKEKAKIVKVIIDKKLGVFEQYEIDETNGDRFLMIGYVSNDDKKV